MFSRASASAPGERSSPVTRTPGRSCDERERDRAGAGADVEHLRALDTLEQREGALDEHLGLGSRHERAAVAAEGEPPEAPFTEDVGERLAPTAPLDERATPV